MKKNKSTPNLEVDLSQFIQVNNFESIVLTDEILKECKLQVDKTKIDNFDDINFVSLFEE